MTMSGKQITDVNRGFLQEQLFETQRALFTATTVRDIRFLQTKINYLKKVMKEKKKAK